MNLLFFRILDSENDAGFAPSFIEKPKIIPNEDGSIILLKCKCRAKPKASVSWFKGTMDIDQSSKISMNIKSLEDDVYELTLEIKVI